MVHKNLLSAGKNEFIMKVRILIMAAFIMIGGCTKTHEQVDIKGKVVYRSCASVVVEVLDENYYWLGQDNWQQNSSRPTFSHVFTVSNDCTFPALTEGKEFYFRVIASDSEGNKCPKCAMFDNPPQKTQIIQVVKTE
jgi:hypothetical protein